MDLIGYALGVRHKVVASEADSVVVVAVALVVVDVDPVGESYLLLVDTVQVAFVVASVAVEEEHVVVVVVAVAVVPLVDTDLMVGAAAMAVIGKDLMVAYHLVEIDAFVVVEVAYQVENWVVAFEDRVVASSGAIEVDAMASSGRRAVAAVEETDHWHSLGIVDAVAASLCQMINNRC